MHMNKPSHPQPKSQGGPTLRLSTQFEVVDLPLTRQRLRRWVQQAIEVVSSEYALDVQHIELAIRFVDTQEGQALNHQYRYKNKPTNVLTFAYGTDTQGTLTADIVICIPVVQQEADDQGKSFMDHLTHLVVHGTLHALGFDHEHDEQAQEMESLETRILLHRGISDPYRAQ